MLDILHGQYYCAIYRPSGGCLWSILLCYILHNIWLGVSQTVNIIVQYILQYIDRLGAAYDQYYCAIYCTIFMVGVVTHGQYYSAIYGAIY